MSYIPCLVASTVGKMAKKINGLLEVRQGTQDSAKYNKQLGAIEKKR